MKTSEHSTDRRSFLISAATITTGIAGFGALPLSCMGQANEPVQGIHMIGPREGYSPQVGTLVSMMNWMRMIVLSSVKTMQREELDFLFDGQANTIGAMLMHLAATERFYQLHTFEGMKWGEWPEAEAKRWNAASELGDDGRREIKGHDISYYLGLLSEVRSHTLSELKKRDDKWLMSVDKEWFWGPTNNYCKWFHVVEHESNHNGQIKWIKGRLPGAKVGE